MISVRRKMQSSARVRGITAPPPLESGDRLTATEFLRRYDADNVPQPDAILMKEAGGSAGIGKDGFIHGPPELVVEIAASSASLDLHDKLDTYRRAGVREYLVWRPVEGRVDWFVLDQDDFLPFKPDARGLLASRCFPGLVLDVAALLRQEVAAVLNRLSKSLGKGAHKTFVASLQRK